MKTLQGPLTLSVICRRFIVFYTQLSQYLRKQVRGEIRALVTLDNLRDTEYSNELRQGVHNGTRYDRA